MRDFVYKLDVMRDWYPHPPSLTPLRVDERISPDLIPLLVSNKTDALETFNLASVIMLVSRFQESCFFRYDAFGRQNGLSQGVLLCSVACTKET